MNRTVATIAFILLVLIVPAHAEAQSPTPQEDVILTEVQTTNQKADDSDPLPSYEEDDPTRNEIDDYGTSNQPLEMDVSDPKSLRFMFGGAANALTPLAIQKAINPLQPKLFVSGHGRICTYRDGELLEEEELGTYRSEPVPELSEAMQLSYQLGPLLGDKYSYAPNDEGVYDFNQFKPLLITGEPPECEDTLEGTEMEAVTAKVAQTQGFFGIVLQVITFFEDLVANLFSQTSGVLSSSQTGTYNEAVERYTVAQKKGDVSYLPGEVQGETEKAGGALNTFFPKQLQKYVADEEKPEGTQPQDFTFHRQPVNTNDWAANLIEEAAVKTGCMLLPKELQNKFFEEGKCGVTVPQEAPPNSCTAMIDSWRAADTSCKLCNTSTINSTQDPNWVTIRGGNLPPSFIKIIEKAADSYHVPASVILGTMYHEGSFTRTSIEWTEENVRKWSCGEEARMPFCDETASTAQLPAGWFPSNFDAAEGREAFWNAVQVVDPSRNSKETTSVCNLMDVVFATAKNLSLSSARVTGDASRQRPPVTQCYSWPLTNRSIPQTCGAWNDNLIAQSSVNYGGYCPEPGKHTPGYPYVDDAPFIDQTISFYDRFSCGR